MNEADSISDPDFGDMTYNGIDAWDCHRPIDVPDSRTQFLAIHVWASSDGPTEPQRAAVRELVGQYNTMWPRIADALVKEHPCISSIAEVGHSLDDSVSVHLGEHEPESLELVYNFDLPDEGTRAFFVTLRDGDVVEVISAS